MPHRPELQGAIGPRPFPRHAPLLVGPTCPLPVATQVHLSPTAGRPLGAHPHWAPHAPWTGASGGNWAPRFPPQARAAPGGPQMPPACLDLGAFGSHRGLAFPRPPVVGPKRPLHRRVRGHLRPGPAGCVTCMGVASQMPPAPTLQGSFGAQPVARDCPALGGTQLHPRCPELGAIGAQLALAPHRLSVVGPNGPYGDISGGFWGPVGRGGTFLLVWDGTQMHFVRRRLGAFGAQLMLAARRAGPGRAGRCRATARQAGPSGAGPSRGASRAPRGGTDGLAPAEPARPRNAESTLREARSKRPADASDPGREPR